ncbi:hypothetical protein Tco_0641024, partial [Tanacetum coccineum]
PIPITESSEAPEVTLLVIKPIILESEAAGSSFTTPTKLTHDQLAEILEKQEKMKITKLSKPEIMKVAIEEVKDVDVIIYSSNEFLRHQEELIRVHSEKLKKKAEMKKKIKKYASLNEIVKSLNIDESLPLTLQDLSKLTKKKRKAIELEPETYIVSLDCNRVVPKGVKFIRNKVIEEPEFGLFFIDELADNTFQRVSDIHKVKTTTIMGYKIIAFYNKLLSNQKFVALMDKIILKRLDKHTLASKKSKLELVGYTEQFLAVK